VRYLKLLLLVLAGFIVIPVGLFLITRIWAAIDRQDRFFVDAAELGETGFYSVPHAESEEDFLFSEKDLPVFAHRISAGHGTVFGFRWFSNGNVIAIDDEGYEKLSLWFKQGVSEGKSHFDLSNGEVVAVYTKGGSAWPRSACFGSITNGAVDVERRDDVIYVDISGGFIPSIRADSEWCKSFPLRIEYRAERLELSEITPWLGRQSDHVYDETYR